MQAKNPRTHYSRALYTVAMVCALLHAAAGLAIDSATSGDWHTGSTWLGGIAPAAGDTVVVNHDVTLGASTAALSSVTINGSLTFSGWATVLDAGNVTVNGTVTHGPQSDVTGTPGIVGDWTPDSRVYIQCTNLVVGGSGSIDVDGKGYQGVYNSTGRGPGGGNKSDWGGGGGYGGPGGKANNGTAGGVVYGAASAPTDPGSSGAGAYPYTAGNEGGNGGGAIRIDAGGTVTVDGSISANGSSGSGGTAGGGSGGSVYVSCSTFGGSGSVSATGAEGRHYLATGWSGGGGGGRVAILYTSATPGVTFELAGGRGGPTPFPPSEPGTLHLTDFQVYPPLAITTSFSLSTASVQTLAAASLTVTDVWVKFDGQQSLNIAGAVTVTGSNGKLELLGPADLSSGSLDVSGSGRLYAYVGDVGGGNYSGSVQVGGAVTVASGSHIYPFSDAQNGGLITFDVGSMTIAAGGTINADGKGFAANYPSRTGYGPGGAIASDFGAGAGYGGVGGTNLRGNAGGPAYGDEEMPLDPGSTGGNGWPYVGGGGGGGVIRIVSSGALTVDGTLSANGVVPTGNSATGGGSGGSIYISVGTFGGSGSLLARGGNGGLFNGDYQGGGGAGGRIAVYRTADVWSGTINVDGGLNANTPVPEAGTIFFGGLNLAPEAVCNDVTVCPDLPVDPQLVGAGSSDPENDPITITLSPAPPYAAGVYNVTVTVTDDQGGMDTCVAVITAQATAGPKTWTGTGDWHTDIGNWDPCIPVDGDDVIIASGTVQLGADSPNLASLTVDAGAALSFTGWDTLLTATTVTVHGTITHEIESDVAGTPGVYGDWTPDARVNINCTDLTVAADGQIDADGKGYAGGVNTTGRGPGGGAKTDWGGGGGYGATGGRANNGTAGGSAYGSATSPIDPGSSGAGAHPYTAGNEGGNGGGAIRIDAGGTVTVDGSISANGVEGGGGTAGGGSGGSIYITTADIAGSGTISARGGNGKLFGGNRSGAGSGGRIYLDYVVATPGVSIELAGGLSGSNPSPPAEPGTLHLTDLQLYPPENITTSFSLSTPSSTLLTAPSLSVANGWVRLESQLTLDIAGAVSVTGSFGKLELLAPTNLTSGSLSVSAGGTLYVYDNGSGSSSVQTGAMSVGAGGTVIPVSDATNGGAVHFTVDSLAVASGGTIAADGTGYNGNFPSKVGYGPGGAGASDWGAGAGHGGVGGTNYTGSAPGGPAYGSASMPTLPGSTGGNGWPYVGGGAGGGVIWIDAVGNIAIDGVLSANGLKPAGQSAAGGGSGGSILLSNCGTLSGSGVLRAEGGEGGTHPVAVAGGGAGGRIALYPNSGTWTGTSSVAGGFGTTAPQSEAGSLFAGSPASCNQPPNAVCQDVSVSLDAAGSASVTGAAVNDGSSDPNGDPLTFTLDQSSFTCADLGANAVVLTVSDPGGAEDTCAATVTVTSAGSCEDLGNAVTGALCGAELSSEQAVLATIDAAVTGFLGGSTICGPPSLEDCQAALLVTLGLGN